MFDDAATQVVQMLGLGIGPTIRHQLSGAAVCRSESVRHDVEVNGLERPAFERDLGRNEGNAYDLGQ